MKQFLAALLTIAFLSVNSLGLAAPVGNISTPSMLKSLYVSKHLDARETGLIVGGEFDFTYDRKAKDCLGNAETRFYGSRIGVVAYDRVLLYGILGVATADQEFGIGGNKVRWETDAGFAFGLGITAILYERKYINDSIFRLGVDVSYRRADLKMEKILLDGNPVADASISVSEFIHDETQAALAVSYQVKRFVPYVGVKYSDVGGDTKATIEGVGYNKDYKSDEHVGFFVGADVLITDSFSVNVEGRFLDEEAISTAANIRL